MDWATTRPTFSRSSAPAMPVRCGARAGAHAGERTDSGTQTGWRQQSPVSNGAARTTSWTPERQHPAVLVQPAAALAERLGRARLVRYSLSTNLPISMTCAQCPHGGDAGARPDPGQEAGFL